MQRAGPPEGEQIWVEILALREFWAERALGPGEACMQTRHPAGRGLCRGFGFSVNAPQF